MPDAPPACSVLAPRPLRGHRVLIADRVGAARPANRNAIAPFEAASTRAALTACTLAVERHGFRNALYVTAGPAVVFMHLVGAWLFASGDTEAGWRGWQVVERRSGLSRRYRDARFDTWLEASHGG